MEPAGKIVVAMTAEMLEAVRESVEAGEYPSTGEVVEDALRLWQQRRLEEAERIATIGVRIRRALDDPRPSLSSEETVRRLESVFERAREDGERA